MTPQSPSPLPYVDTKAQGAAGFYLGINSTFRFIKARFGLDGLEEYWRSLGETYYAPVSHLWTKGGLHGVAEYWRAFFAAEPEARVIVEQTPDAVLLKVERCPAIHHLRESGQTIVEEYCQHCYWVSHSIGQPAGISLQVRGGNGACEQKFGLSPSEQDFSQITRCT